MASRLYKIGTIYSRVKGLIEKGGIRETDEPLWLTVYEHFPPKYEPAYDRPAPEMEVRQIIYPEDVIRAKLHEKHSAVLGLIDLENEKKTASQKMIEKCNENISKGMSEDEAISKAYSETEKIDLSILKDL